MLNHANLHHVANIVQSQSVFLLNLAIVLLIVLGLKILWRNSALVPKSIAATANKAPYSNVNQKDVSAIAGADVIATQFDLACIYKEMGKNDLAKNVLQDIIRNGTPQQQREARDLFTQL